MFPSVGFVFDCQRTDSTKHIHFEGGRITEQFCNSLNQSPQQILSKFLALVNNFVLQMNFIFLGSTGIRPLALTQAEAL
jgi:hypothetical protein